MAIGDSNHKGNVAELKIAAAAADLGIGVYMPMIEHGRVDMIFAIGDRLVRVQCKWARRQGDVLVVQTGGSYHSPTRGYVRSTYDASEVDAITAYCGDNNRCYFVPIAEIEGQHCLRLRLAPARNGQFAGVRMAADYELGAVAQLVVAPPWHGGGRRFESDQLHSSEPGVEVVGAHDFRNRFGLFMERASRGDTFHVTRRGKPHVVLSPAERTEPLELDELTDAANGGERNGTPLP